MKTIGLIGGMSWESTLEYYRIMNEAVKEKLGGFHSAKLVLYSMDFAEVEEMQHKGEWDRAAGLLTDAARRVEAAGAERVAVVGGVAANSELRASLPQAVAAPLPLCTDNAAMIAVAGLLRLRAGERQGAGHEVRARWPLAELRPPLP